jgi:hypothetical protein
MYKDLEKKFDIRVIEKKIQEGVVTHQEYEDYLQRLPDVSANIDEEYRLNFREMIKENKNEESREDFPS